MTTPIRHNSIIETCKDPRVFGPWFNRAVGEDTWVAWMAFIRALFGLGQTAKVREQRIFRECTGRDAIPTGNKSVDEAWLIVGRRGGKSLILALIAVWLALFRDWSEYLTPGEYGTVMVIAADRKQARTLFRYIQAFIDNIPALARYKTAHGQTKDTITLRTNIQIEIHTANFRTTRGYTLVAVLLDEVAFWKNEGTNNPDAEILEALRPGMSTIPGAMLLAASSPYARRGVLYDAWKENWGKEQDDVLVWKAPTWVMNPNLPRDGRVIARSYARDPVKAASEYGADFRGDVSGFFPDEVIDLAMADTRPEVILPNPHHTYYAFGDPSGGRHDDFTIAVGHYEGGDRFIVDTVRGRKPPFNPKEVVAEFVDNVLRPYGLISLQGDYYSGEWVVSEFAQHGVSYEPAEFPKSQLYLESLPHFTQGRVSLPNLHRVRVQMQQLERRTRQGGKDVVDHPPHGHDDWINVCCGVVSQLADATGAKIDYSAGATASEPLIAAVDVVGGSMFAAESHMGIRRPYADDL